MYEQFKSPFVNQGNTAKGFTRNLMNSCVFLSRDLTLFPINPHIIFLTFVKEGVEYSRTSSNV